ncbi:MAG: hypothetical protein MUC63_03935, partial [Planctomycetes bacterium]|nr:hypothetical protein [Planctomycetota bacterium]
MGREDLPSRRHPESPPGEAASAAIELLFACKDLVDGRAPLLEGCRRIASLEARLAPEDREEIALFRAVASEADRSPGGPALESASREIVLFTCRRILEKGPEGLPSRRAAKEGLDPSPRGLFRVPLPPLGPGAWIPAGVLCGLFPLWIAREGGGAFLRASWILVLPGAAALLAGAFYLPALVRAGIRRGPASVGENREGRLRRRAALAAGLGTAAA